MFLFGTNTSPLGCTRVTSGGSLQAALYLANVISVCWQGVPLLPLRVNDTPRMYLHYSVISCLSLGRLWTLILPSDCHRLNPCF